MYLHSISLRDPRYRLLSLFAIALLAVGLALPFGGKLFSGPPQPISGPNIELGKLPLLFEPNAGQDNQAVRFKAHTPGGTLFFTPSEVVLALSAGDEGRTTNDESSDPSSVSVRLAFLGANPNPPMLGGDTTGTRVSYFVGNDPASWQTDMPTYADVTYSGLYPGIDLRYEGSNSHLKGTYIVSPGADPTQISWRYQGAQGVSVDEAGNLQIALSSVLPSQAQDPQSSVLTEAAPVAWQEIGGARVPVEASYLLASDGSIGFALGSYDAAYPLIIDPTLTYSTYIGGNFAEYGFGIAADAAGYFYVVGFTNSSNFPTVNPFQPNLIGSSDGWVARFNPQGQPVYITYLGGNSSDYALDVATDGQGNAYVTGFTSSSNFPTANAFQPAFGGGIYDAFITKLNPAGSALVFSTYLGGNEEENSHGSGSQSGSIALDAAGNIYVTGFTQSENFPVLNAIQPTHYNIDDLFITKLNPSASALIWSTYLGGLTNEQPKDIVVDSANNVYVTGFTDSGDFPLMNPAQSEMLGTRDVFVTKINAAGTALVYSTYWGGAGGENGAGIAVDGLGNAYISGDTDSNNFPVLNAYQFSYGGFNDAFVSKFGPTGTPVYSTYLGGDSVDGAYSVAVNAAGEAYSFGSTQSEEFPVMNPIIPTLRGTEDAFVTRFNAAGNGLVFSTFFGGTNGREMQGPGAMTVDANNNIYITGNTGANDLPTVNPFQPFPGSAFDAFISRISENSPTSTPTSVGTPMPTPTVCAVADYTITQSTGATIVPGTTFVPNSDCDNCTAPLLFPFPVQFYNQTFTQGRVSSNGNLQFTSNNHLPFNSCLPNSTYDNTIFAYWDDLFLDDALAGLGVFTSTSGSAPNRIFNIEWRAESIQVPGGTLNFEIRLYENQNGKFEIIYGTMAEDGDSATVGAQRDTGSRFTQHSCDQGVISQGLKLTFTLPACQVNTPVVTATPTVCAVADYTIAQSTGATIVPGTTFVPNSACNDCTAPILFPFPVQFYNQTFTQGRASSNGNLQFTSNNHLPFNSCLPNPTYDNVIYGYWDDLFLDCQAGWGCGIYTSVSGSAPNRTFNIEWRAHRNEPPIVDINFEIRLYENNNGGFDIIYGELDNPGSTASVGAQRDTGSRFTQYSCDQAILSQGLKLAFTLPPCQVSTPTSTPVATATATNTPLPQPTLLYSTYFSSWERDSIEDIGQDAAGNIYVAGTTFEFDINYGDILVAKFSPNGQTLLWKQIIGGTRIDYGYALAVDAAGNATVAGIATSNDYPLLNPLQPAHAAGIYDVVMTKLNPQGNMIFSTYLGGNGTDYAERLATDALGNIYVTGRTDSTNWPTTAGAFQTTNQGQNDGYVTKITPNGSAIVWSTYLGGLYSDSSNDIALDGAGNIYLTGLTASDNFPLLNAFQSTNQDNGDAFVTKMNSTGSALIYSTYLGGSNPPGPGEDNGQGIAVDAAGHAYVTGYTEAPDFPVTAGAYQPFFRGFKDAFVTKFTPAGNELVYSTFLGGTLNPPYGEDIAYDIAINSLGQAHITGKTYTPDFPIVNAVQPVPGDVYDAFVTKFNASGSGLIYSTFLGGDYQLPSFTGQDTGNSILIDGAGNAVIGGGTGSHDFPTVNAYQYNSEGPGDGFIAKIGFPAPVLTPTPIPTTATATATSTVPTATGTPPTATITPTACAIQFADVPSGHTFYDFIQCLACREIITGYNCGGPGEPCNGNNDPYFRPQNNVTRGQIAKIVSESAGLIEPVSGQTFQDVPIGSTFYDFIERLVAQEVMSGYLCGGPGEPCVAPDNRPYFRPNSTATRGQLAKIVSNAAAYQEPVTGQTFEDVPPGHTFYDFIERLATRGVMSGYACGSPEPCVPPDNRPYFRPANNVTRGQTSKIVANTFFPECNPSKE